MLSKKSRNVNINFIALVFDFIWQFSLFHLISSKKNIYKKGKSMIRVKNILIVLLFLLFSTTWTIADDDCEKSKMIGELESIKNIFDFQYAPKAWKKEIFGWDLDEAIEKAKQQVMSTNPITVKDFQLIVRNFFRSTRDYHVNVMFISTESAFLPIEIKGANGRYFITHVNHKLLSPDEYPIQAGDEVILFDDQPIDEVVYDLQMSEFGTKNIGTDRSLTERMLTNRSGMAGHEVPRGAVAIQIKSAETQALKTYQLIWTYKPERITNHSLAAATKASLQKKPQGVERMKQFNKPWMTPYYKPDSNKLLKQILSGSQEDEEEEEEEDDETPFSLAAKQSFVPSLGRIWWSNDKDYWNAYIFETPKRQLVGYLRIPTYNDLEGASLDELKGIIEIFEERTDALIIDQVNNPGGYVLYMYAVASLLTDQSLQTPKHRLAITHEDVFNAVSNIPQLENLTSDKAAKKVIGMDICGYPVSYQFAQHWLEYCRFISDQWNKDKKFSDAYHFFGVDHINPNSKVHYTKPLLVLINELSFSCADFLPAILQDNFRATIMGTQTSGAGGCVLRNTFKSRFGIAGFSITGSIAQRTDNRHIENLGITPDISYELTEEDYQQGYQGYKSAVLDAIDGLLAPPEPTL
jgi:hypothetical protein